MIIEEIQNKYKAFKQKDGDGLLIKIGVVGVLIGWILSMSFLKHFFAWFILLGAGIKLFEYVTQAQKRFEKESHDDKPFSVEVQEKWAAFKKNQGEMTLIKIGVVGVILGWVFSFAFLNHFFAWFILAGLGIKLYDYVFENKNNTVENKV